MRVCMITGSYPPMHCGNADPVQRLSNELAKRGVAVDVITSASASGSELEPGVSVFPVVKDFDWSIRNLRPVLTTLARRRPNVVNIHYEGLLYGQSRSVTLLPLMVKSMSPRTRVVLNLPYPRGTHWFSWSVWQRALRKSACLVRDHLGWFDPEYGTLLSHSDRVIAMSRVFRARLATALPSAKEKIVVIPWGASVAIAGDAGPATRQAARELMGFPRDRKIIAYYGYLYPGKGLETLLEAFALLSSREPDLQLIIIGGADNFVNSNGLSSNYQDDLRNRAAQLGVADLVRWTGFLAAADQRASSYLRCSDVCVLPFDDGATLHRSSLATALAHHMPIVTTRSDFTDEELRDGENMLLCPPCEPNTLAETIYGLLHSCEIRARISSGAETLHRERFAWDVVVEDTLRAFGN